MNYGVIRENSAKPDRSSQFVNNVRFWSMFAVIAVHSAIGWGIYDKPGTARELQLILVQIVKFGTIGFYIISGLLLGERLPQYSGRQYLQRRVKTVGLPWAFWASLFILLPFAKGLLFGRANGGMSDFGLRVAHRAAGMLFFSSYWFVPNFLFALAVLLLFRRYLDSLWFGLAALGISLFYGVNVYGQWVPSSHTSALLGFVFYLWLGNWTSRHFSVVAEFAERVKLLTLATAIILAASVAHVEAHWLGRFAPNDTMNSLKISNQVFSILVVLAFLKCQRATWPQWVNVRGSTFGLYLIHPVLALLLQASVASIAVRLPKNLWSGALTGANRFWNNPFAVLGVWIGTFLVCYGGSLVIVRALENWPELGWVIGQWRTTVAASAKADAFQGRTQPLGGRSGPLPETEKANSLAKTATG